MSVRKSLVACIAALIFIMSQSALAADTYSVDPVHSVVIFKIQHMGAGMYMGRINDPSGTVTVDEGDPTKDTFDLAFDVANVDTHNEARDKHLKSPDFFNAAQFPQITFKSKSIKKTDDTHYEVTGDLTLHGVTKEITIPITKTGEGNDPMGAHRAGFETTFTLKRSDYGMNKMVGPNGVGDEVTLMVTIEGIKK